MRRPILKRLFAYIVDLIIVVVIASLFIDMPILNPYFDKYLELSESLVSYLNGGEVLTQEAINNLQYEFVYYSFYSSIILISIKILYFILFQYINKGKTIGKAIFKIELVSEKRKLKFYQVLLSSLIICNIFTQSITLVLLRTLSKSSFMSISGYISTIELTIAMITVVMITMRKDARGLHDLISNTSVVYRKEEKND